MYNIIYFILSEKHSAHHVWAEPGDAVHDTSLSSASSVRFALQTRYINTYSYIVTLKIYNLFGLSRAEDGFEKLFIKPDQKKFTSALLQAYRDRNVSVFL